MQLYTTPTDYIGIRNFMYFNFETTRFQHQKGCSYRIAMPTVLRKKQESLSADFHLACLHLTHRRLISAQLPKGTSNWDVPLNEVYLIGIMEFQFNNINSNYLHNITLMNKDTGKVFYKGMGYKFLELPNLIKRKANWLQIWTKEFYLLNNLSRMDEIPDFLDKRVFQKIFKIAEMSKMTKEERELYHSDVKAKSDWNAGIRYAEKKAIEKGRYEEALIIAIKLKSKGMSIDEIAEITGLTIEEIENLK